ncbi:hypothetical protein [Candidatus Nitrosotalea bavarica]|uniref:hypothetical protein n=1 Tax=Candidatus Nitrosotalea bavarica TaxID=1903277 RepID=UPI000C70EE23|nr:hypothetical protein [Candidatus Nitrosotalea bavarica]
MEFVLESALNLLGFVVGLVLGIFAYIGFKNTGSPTLFRLSISFFSISIGFGVVGFGFLIESLVLGYAKLDTWIQTLGLGIQTIGYFFIAFSHGIKSFFPKSRYFKSIAMPLFIIPGNSIEHIIRSISFILLVYGTIETILSYMENRKRSTIFVAAGLGLLALGEFLGWYSIVFPKSVLYFISVSTKIVGLGALFVPISQVPLRGARFGNNI